MALLTDAIRQSSTQAAYCQTGNDTAVIVQRVTGREQPYNQEEYAVSVQRGANPPTQAFAAENLLEAIERMRDFGLPGFDPEASNWSPAPA